MSIPGYIPYTPGQPVTPNAGVLQAPRYVQNAQGQLVPTGTFDPVHAKIVADTGDIDTMRQALGRLGQFQQRIAYDNLGQARQVLQWKPAPWLYQTFGIHNPNPPKQQSSSFNPYYA
jgi:hypothetical protein